MSKICSAVRNHFLNQRWAKYGPPECIMRPVGTFVKTTVNIKILLFNLETVLVRIVKRNVHVHV